MTIIFISHLSSNIAAGMNWSVPASVHAQEKIDDVLWVNYSLSEMPHFKDSNAYHNISDFAEFGVELHLDIFPKKYRRPDVVVFEGLYFKEYLGLSKELRKKNVPYVIVPRGSMTKQALHNHAWLKKWFAHKMYFNSFIRHAWKIQYLTRQEADDSHRSFKTDYFIVPNGISIPIRTKNTFSKGNINAVFIGRLDIYHKGLDLLLAAIDQLQSTLRECNFKLSVYGPRKYDYEKIAKQIERQCLSDIVYMKGEVTGEEKTRALLDADVFVMTSRFEGHPMGLIEALAYGLPCLVTPGTNMAEEIGGADAGWVCEESVEGVKKALCSVVNEQSLYVTKGRNASVIAKRYNWEDLAKAFHKELEQIIK